MVTVRPSSGACRLYSVRNCFQNSKERKELVLSVWHASGEMNVNVKGDIYLHIFMAVLLLDVLDGP